MADSSEVPTPTTDEALSLEQRVEDVLQEFGAPDSGNVGDFVYRVIALVREQIARDIEELRAAAVGKWGYEPGNTPYNEAIDRATRIARNGASS